MLVIWPCRHQQPWSGAPSSSTLSRAHLKSCASRTRMQTDSSRPTREHGPSYLLPPSQIPCRRSHAAQTGHDTCAPPNVWLAHGGLRTQKHNQTMARSGCYVPSSVMISSTFLKTGTFRLNEERRGCGVLYSAATDKVYSGMTRLDDQNSLQVARAHALWRQRTASAPCCALSCGARRVVGTYRRVSKAAVERKW